MWDLRPRHFFMTYTLAGLHGASHLHFPPLSKQLDGLAGIPHDLHMINNHPGIKMAAWTCLCSLYFKCITRPWHLFSFVFINNLFFFYILFRYVYRMMSTIDLPLPHSRFPNEEEHISKKKRRIASHQKREGNRAYDTSIFMGSIPTFNHQKKNRCWHDERKWNLARRELWRIPQPFLFPRDSLQSRGNIRVSRHDLNNRWGDPTLVVSHVKRAFLIFIFQGFEMLALWRRSE